jgi:hypothetical protein
MSLDISVYTKQLSDQLIPKMQARLNDFEMACEIHPEFSFTDQNGFLPFKFRLTSPPFDILRNKILTCGFELFINKFDLAEEKSKRKQRLFNRLLQRATTQPLVTNEIDDRLIDCKYDVSFVWHSVDSFEFRFASLTSAILTELTNGVCTYSHDIWYRNENLVENAWREIKEYESSLLKEKDLKFHEFEKW